MSRRFSCCCYCCCCVVVVAVSVVVAVGEAVDGWCFYMSTFVLKCCSVGSSGIAFVAWDDCVWYLYGRNDGCPFDHHWQKASEVVQELSLKKHDDTVLLEAARHLLCLLGKWSYNSIMCVTQLCTNMLRLVTRHSIDLIIIPPISGINAQRLFFYLIIIPLFSIINVQS